MRSRPAFVKTIFWRPSSRLISTLYGVFALLQWGVGEFGSPWLAERVRLGNNIPQLSGWQWLALGLAIVVGIEFEGAFREARSLDERISSLQTKLDDVTDDRRAGAAWEDEFTKVHKQLSACMVREVTSEQGVDRLAVDVEAIRNEAAEWLAKNVSQISAQRFTNIIGAVDGRYTGAFNDKHNNVLHLIARYLKNLEALPGRRGS